MMKKLKHSNVKRSGVSVDYWNNETSNVSARVKNGLQFRFNMASKGGGKTDVMLSVGTDDIRPLLVEIAEECPQLADAFAEATQRAVQSLTSAR